MGVFNFDTKNQYIDGKIEYSVSDKSSSGYKITAKVFLRRNNSYSGTPTHGKITYRIYAGATTATWKNSGEKTTHFTVPNGGAWVQLGTFSTKVSADPMETYTYCVGFRASSSDNITGLMTEDLVYKDDIEEKSYAGWPKKPTINIIDNGDNTATITRSPASEAEYASYSGRNCPAYGCKCFFNVNKEESKPPSSTENYDGSYNNDSETWRVYPLNLHWRVAIDPEDELIKIQAVAYTLASVDGSSKTNLKHTSGPCEVKVKYIKHYAPPVWDKKVWIEHIGSTHPDSDATFIAKWNQPTAANKNSPVMGHWCALYITYKGDTEATIIDANIYLDPEVTQYNISENLSAKGIELQDGDKLDFWVVPYTKDARTPVKNMVWDEPGKSGNLTVVAPPMMRVCTGRLSSGVCEWKCGVPYVCVDRDDSGAIWHRADSVWVARDAVIDEDGNRTINWHQSI